MNKKLLIIFCIFAATLSYYMPMKKKSIDFGKDICYYSDSIHDTDYEYVMGCEKGKYCQEVSSSYDIYMCLPYTPITKMLDDQCEVNSDCDSGLECKDKKCSIVNSQYYYKNNLIFCPEGYIYNKTFESNGANSLKCIQKSSSTEKCYIRTKLSTGQTIINEYEPDYFKVCGEINYEKDSTTHSFTKLSTNMNYLGEVDDGKIVENTKACKSGYALQFYGDGTLEKPFSDADATGNGNSKTFKHCVTVKEVEYSNSQGPNSNSLSCKIKYTKGDGKEYIYYSTFCDSYLLTKLDLWTKYIDRMNSIRTDCETKRHYDEPFLCDDNELKKLQYFYDHPEKYLLYQNDKQITDYLVQQEYPSYEAQDLSNGILFINIKYFIFLLILISL